MESVQLTQAPQWWMYNLTVEEARTFFVGDGQWLVHNCADFKTIGGHLKNLRVIESGRLSGYSRAILRCQVACKQLVTCSKL